ncbi:MAG TPA: SH3 domain-containing protein [Chloroflexota bacterium]|nr:SH3 domain-containing protein [Chloroflexota bacterium]
MRRHALTRLLGGLALLGLVGWLLGPASAAGAWGIIAATPPGQTDGPLAIGSGAWVVGTGGAGLDVRSAPLLTSTTVGGLPDGTPVQVLEGPISASGLIWYRVSASGLAGSGWVDGAYLAAAPPAPPPLPVGSTARVTDTQGSGLDVRSAPLLGSAVMGGLGPGTVAQVLEGPVEGDGLLWYRVTAPDLASPGWVDGQYLAPATAVAAAPPPAQPVALPPPAGAAPPPAAAPPPSAVAPPAPAPPAAPTPSPVPPPPAPPTATPLALAVGGNALVGGAGPLGLRIRANPGLSSPQIGTVFDGARVDILAGPVALDGQNWFQIGGPTIPAQGWVVGSALRPVR